MGVPVEEPRRFGWAPFWAAATVFSVAAALYFSGRERQVAQDALRLQDRLRDQAIELARLHQAFAILDHPGAITVFFGEERSASSTVFANPQGVLLIAHNLPPLPAGKAFEMWVIPKGARPVPSGMFRAGAERSAMHVSRQRCDPGDTVEVTMENEAGAGQPAHPPLVSAIMPAAAR